MQNTKRPNSTPMGMAFLFLSLAILPVSFKATGYKVELNPSFHSVIDAWGQMASAFRSGDQSITAARLSALNFDNAPEPIAAPVDMSYETASLYDGQAQSPEADCCEQQESIACSSDARDKCSGKCSGECGDCPKTKRQPARVTKRGELVAVWKTELASETNFQRMEVVRALHSITPITDKLQDHIARYRVGFGPELARSLKELRVRRVKIGKAVVSIPPTISDCDFRKLMQTVRESQPAEQTETESVPVRAIEAPVSTSEGSQA